MSPVVWLSVAAAVKKKKPGSFKNHHIYKRIKMSSQIYFSRKNRTPLIAQLVERGTVEYYT